METSIKIAPPLHQQLGPNIVINAPIPTRQIPNVDPFLLLHHFGPIDVSSKNDFLVPPHPHKGFEAITFLFSGSVEHKDSLGNSGVLHSGDIQWMTAGNGIEHQEGYPYDDKTQTLEGIQLWVNLPASSKREAPRYQDIQSKDIPEVIEGSSVIRVFAGTFDGKTAPTKTVTDLTALYGKTDKGYKRVFDIPVGYNVILYTVHGNIEVHSGGDYVASEGSAVVINNSSQPIEIETTVDSQFVLLYGKPINEPIASYGPFVMNYHEEINVAIREYRSGAWGSVAQ